MRENQQPEERSALLSQAIDLCTNLCDILERFGPSRFTQSDHRPAVSKVCELESTLHDRLRQLDEKRNEALAPVSRLPDDILRLIIQHGHHDEPLEVYPIRTSLVRRVSHMSRRWRAIVLDMASVWTYVRFSSQTYSAEEFKPIHPSSRRVRVLSEMYTCNRERSKQSPLKVELQLSPPPVVSTMIKAYLQICSNGVAELNLSVDTSAPNGVNAVIPCITHASKTLRCLRIRVRDPLWDRGKPEPMKALLACDLPRLAEVELHSFRLPIVHRPEYTAFLRCRSILLEMTSEDKYRPAGLLALLSGVPQLEKLHVSLPWSPNLDVANAEVQLPHLLLPELRSISYHSALRPRDTFGRLVAPKLESLSVDIYELQPSERQPYVTELLEFVVGCSASNGAPPPMTQFTIQGGRLEGLERILRVLPQIEVLRAHVDYEGIICLQPVYPDLLSQLVPTEYSASESEEVAGCPPLCSQLKVLGSLSYATGRHIQRLTTLAAHRRSCGNPLTRIRMTDWEPVSNRTLGMPDEPSEQHRLEKELAKEVEVLECGEFRWEWKEGGRWRREGTVRGSDWGEDQGRVPGS